MYARIRGWRPAGPFNLGRAAFLINIVGLVYGIGAIADIFWPQSPASPWYVNYAIPFTTVVVIGSGAVYAVLGKPYDRGKSPAGDAVKS